MSKLPYIDVLNGDSFSLFFFFLLDKTQIFFFFGQDQKLGLSKSVTAKRGNGSKGTTMKSARNANSVENGTNNNGIVSGGGGGGGENGSQQQHRPHSAATTVRRASPTSISTIERNHVISTANTMVANNADMDMGELLHLIKFLFPLLVSSTCFLYLFKYFNLHILLMISTLGDYQIPVMIPLLFPRDNIEDGLALEETLRCACFLVSL